MTTPTAEPPDPQRPMLFLVLDGVPFDVALELWRAGRLRGFGAPRPMVSVFPSLTHVAVPALVRSVFNRRPPGYEARYFHPPSGVVRGGFSDEEAEAALEPYHARVRGNLGHTAVYLMPTTLASGQIRWITRQATRNPGPWLAYLTATDGIGHFQGRAAMVEAVDDIFARIEAAREEYANLHGVRPGAVLCSDHGFGFADPMEHLAAESLEASLREAGFEPEGATHDAVHLPALGAVGGGVVHCSPERAEEVARVVAAVEGVDLAVAGHVGGGGAELFGGATPGRARVHWSGDDYAYAPLEGDLLRLAPLFRDAGGWIDEEPLLARTWDAPYPHAPARIRHGLTRDVQWPAPVLFSMAHGWTYGPRLTHAAAQLRGGQVGTHGALDRPQTLGFAAATEPWPTPAGPLRPYEVFRPWRDLVRQGSALADDDAD